MERRHIFRGTVNFILLLIVAGSIFLVKKLWSPFEQGMFCDDQSINYPYSDHETVSDTALLLFGVAMPLALIFILEFVRTRRESVGKPVKLFGRDMNPWFWAAYCSVGTFLFGCACSQLSTDIAKYTIGRLRPHFIDICKPDWSKINCSVPYQYIFPIPCTATDAHRMKEARLSFPSGHASFSAYTMIYLVIYLQVRFRFRAPELLRPFLQFICLLLTFYTSLSRISDYKHHWSDVLSGFVLGAVVAVLIAVYFSDLFPRELPTQIKKGQEVFLQEYTGTDGHETHTARTNVAD